MCNLGNDLIIAILERRPSIMWGCDYDAKTWDKEYQNDKMLLWGFLIFVLPL